MLTDWLWLFVIGATFADVDSLPTSSFITSTTADEAKKSEQLTGELKGTLSNSGLDDGLTESEQQQQQQKQQQTLISKQSNTAYIMKQRSSGLPSRERNYVYGKVVVNEMGDTLPHGVWYLPSNFGRYYNEDRRKRSEDSTQQPSSSASSTVSSPSSQAESSSSSSSSSSQAELPSPISQQQHHQQQEQQQAAAFLTQPKRSLVTYYQEPRYKRQSDFDPEDFYALLSLYDEDRRNRQNWRNYDNEDYENIDDDINMIGIDDEDPRGASWLENPMIGYPSHHYDPVLDSELAALSRARSNYYDQYLQGQYGNSINSGQQQYDSGVQYGTPQYDLPYVQHAYYPSEKRFMVSRKRSQNYDTYGARGGLLLNSRGYPNYQHRLLY